MRFKHGAVALAVGAATMLGTAGVAHAQPSGFDPEGFKDIRQANEMLSAAQLLSSKGHTAAASILAGQAAAIAQEGNDDLCLGAPICVINISDVNLKENIVPVVW